MNSIKYLNLLVHFKPWAHNAVLKRLFWLFRIFLSFFSKYYGRQLGNSKNVQCTNVNIYRDKYGSRIIWIWHIVIIFFAVSPSPRLDVLIIVHCVGWDMPLICTVCAIRAVRWTPTVEKSAAQAMLWNVLDGVAWNNIFLPESGKLQNLTFCSFKFL